MLVPHNTLVVVADGRQLLFLRNEGDGDRPALVVERKDILENPKDSDQKTDAAGRASSTRSSPGAPPVAQGGAMHAMGGGAQFAPSGGTMGEADYHQLEEDRFAAELAAMLNRDALAHAFDRLIVIAPPRTLGELRKHYHEEVETRIAAEIAKDLTRHTIPDMEEVLRQA